MDNEKKSIEIGIKPEVAKGSYSNLVIVSHSKSEFVLDFAAMLPAVPKAEVGSRVIMTPEHCKRLLNTLKDNIAKYEARFGYIEVGGPQPSNTFNFEDFTPNGTKS